MARITVEDCIDKFSSRFELVLVASQRARKLHSGEEPTIERDNDKNTVIALREIADSTISKEEIKENLIQEYQTISISDEEQENQELQAPIEKDELNEDTEEMSKENLVTKTEVEQEMNELVSQEDDEIKEQYEINEGEENNIDSNTDEQKLESESLE
jgi:DNA-directed RNA polymerase subunit omega